jgi:hypothetical protein
MVDARQHVASLWLTLAYASPGGPSCGNFPHPRRRLASAAAPRTTRAMPVAIELTATAIRLCRIDGVRVQALESYPIPAEADPLATLAAAPLPSNLGEVRVLLSHPDLLIRTIVQPPVPQDRLGRMVQFELKSLAQEGDALLTSWRLASLEGDMRITALVAKRSLVDAVREALAPHGARLGGLTVHGTGLYHAWRHQAGEDTSSALLVDLGGQWVHTCLIEGGELLFVRSSSPGIDELIKDVAQLRGIEIDDARSMLSAMGDKAPQDLRDLVQRHTVAIATTIGNHMRFAKAQLQLERFEPHAIHLAGAGARIAGVPAAMEERLKAPVRLLNPFAGRLFDLQQTQLDAEARLPSPHSVVIGAAGADSLCLDVIDELREERRAYWRTSGVLRSSAALCVALLVLAAVVLEMSAMSLATADTELNGDGNGLVPTAQASVAEAKAIAEARDAMRARVDSLARERDVSRVAVEYLNLIAEIQHPEDRPVYLRRYGVQLNQPGAVQVEMEGFGEDARRRSKSEVVNAFREQMLELYNSEHATIGEVKNLSAGVEAQRLPFHWIIQIDTGAAK